jgi:DNA polymerase-3 subunit epsilon
MRPAGERPGSDRETFVALDFETADPGRDSACAVGIVRVENRRIVRSESRLIRPPRRPFAFTPIHGISWEDVADAPPFGDVWGELERIVEGARFLAAHNAAFDRSVLQTCCERAGLLPPAIPFECTVRVSRRVWGIRPTKLPDVCRALDLRLRHHDARSDAEACARIMIAALQEESPRPGGEGDSEAGPLYS